LSRIFSEIFRFFQKSLVARGSAGSGYPAPHDVLAKLWEYGFIKVNVGGSIHPAKYACKYITKMKGKDFMMAMMWFFNIRTYTFSRAFKYRSEDKASNEWEFLRREKGKDGRLENLGDAVKRLMDAGYYIFNIGLLKLRTGYVGVFD
jgi:hypothetical protein